MRWKQPGTADILNIRALVLTAQRWIQYWQKINLFGVPSVAADFLMEVAPIATVPAIMTCAVGVAVRALGDKARSARPTFVGHNLSG